MPYMACGYRTEQCRHSRTFPSLQNVALESTEPEEERKRRAAESLSIKFGERKF